MWELSISNIAGIHDATATLRPGTTAVQASNWQGKTSFVTALRTVLGAEPTPNTVTAGEREGEVTLTTESGTYGVTVTCEDGKVSRTGDPYVTEQGVQVATELFACLDGQNPIRSAVRNGEDLTPLLTKPLEHENIDAQIDDRKRERKRLRSELDRAETAAKKLPTKQRRLEELGTELTELRDELADLDPTSADDQSDHRERLNERRTEHEHLRKSVTRLENKVRSLEDDLSGKRDRLADINVPDDPEVDDDIDAKQDQLSRMERAVDTLQTLYNANRQVLERDQLELITDVERSLGGDTVACWVCGSEADRGVIEDQLTALSDTITVRQERAESLRETVEDLEAKRDQFREQRREKQRLESSVSSLESRLEERRADLEETREQLSAAEATIEELEADLAETDQRRSDLEQEIARTETTAESIREEYEELRQQADQRTQLQSQIESVTEEIESLRTRRERRIADTRSTFEAALADIVDALEPSFEAARLEKHVDPDTNQTQRLDLIVARDGREVAVAELSEGEVELVGFIAALAGYEAFDVAANVPCLLLDEVGGLASDNLGDLVRYLQTRTRYLVTTVYPEAGGFDCRTVSPADWSVVSDTSNKSAD